MNVKDYDSYSNLDEYIDIYDRAKKILFHLGVNPMLVNNLNIQECVVNWIEQHGLSSGKEIVDRLRVNDIWDENQMLEWTKNAVNDSEVRNNLYISNSKIVFQRVTFARRVDIITETEEYELSDNESKSVSRVYRKYVYNYKNAEYRLDFKTRGESSFNSGSIELERTEIETYNGEEKDESIKLESKRHKQYPIIIIQKFTLPDGTTRIRWIIPKECDASLPNIDCCTKIYSYPKRIVINDSEYNYICMSPIEEEGKELLNRINGEIIYLEYMFSDMDDKLICGKPDKNNKKPIERYCERILTYTYTRSLNVRNKYMKLALDNFYKSKGLLNSIDGRQD